MDVDGAEAMSRAEKIGRYSATWVTEALWKRMEEGHKNPFLMDLTKEWALSRAETC